MAEKTRSGYVYILSNIGSFGEEVVKIGLTRRLDPADRVRQLLQLELVYIAIERAHTEGDRIHESQSIL